MVIFFWKLWKSSAVARCTASLSGNTGLAWPVKSFYLAHMAALEGCKDYSLWFICALKVQYLCCNLHLSIYSFVFFVKVMCSKLWLGCCWVSLTVVLEQYSIFESYCSLQMSKKIDSIWKAVLGTVRKVFLVHFLINMCSGFMSWKSMGKNCNSKYIFLKVYINEDLTPKSIKISQI